MIKYDTYRKIYNYPVAGDYIKGTGFFVWFSSSEVAHLATVKEQSREYLRGHFPYILCCLLITVSSFFLKSSIRQYLPVPAMSILTTGDLEENVDNLSTVEKRIVTSGSYHQVVNTHGEVRRR